jgi:hypothetical protein
VLLLVRSTRRRHAGCARLGDSSEFVVLFRIVAKWRAREDSNSCPPDRTLGSYVRCGPKCDVRAMSVLPPIATEEPTPQDVSNVPGSCTAANSISIQSPPWRGRAACRHFEAESHGGLEVDHQLEFGRMPHWDGLRAFCPSACDRPGWPTSSPDRSSRPRVLRMARSPEGPPHRAAGRSCCRDSRKNYTTARPCPDRPPRPAPWAARRSPTVRLDHGGRSELRIAEHDDRTRPHVEAEFLGGGSMIDFGEDREAGRLPLFNRGFKSRDGFFHRILARLGDQAVAGCTCGSR